jgi:hypothetical protein
MRNGGGDNDFVRSFVGKPDFLLDAIQNGSFLESVILGRTKPVVFVQHVAVLEEKLEALRLSQTGITRERTV